MWNDFLNKVIIKIYPEWNVNEVVDQQLNPIINIKIYPEWNVNKNKSIADNVPAN